MVPCQSYPLLAHQVMGEGLDVGEQAGGRGGGGGGIVSCPDPTRERAGSGHETRGGGTFLRGEAAPGLYCGAVLARHW